MKATLLRRSFCWLRYCSKIRHVKCSEIYLHTNRNHSQQKPLRRREQRPYNRYNVDILLKLSIEIRRYFCTESNGGIFIYMACTTETKIRTPNNHGRNSKVETDLRSRLFINRDAGTGGRGTPAPLPFTRRGRGGQRCPLDNFDKHLFAF